MRSFFLVVVVAVVITPPLSQDGGTARTAIQVCAVNLIEIGTYVLTGGPLKTRLKN